MPDPNDILLQEFTKVFRIDKIFGPVVMAIDAVNVAVIVGIATYKIEPLGRLSAHFFNVVNVELCVFEHASKENFHQIILTRSAVKQNLAIFTHRLVEQDSQAERRSEIVPELTWLTATLLLPRIMESFLISIILDGERNWNIRIRGTLRWLSMNPDSAACYCARSGSGSLSGIWWLGNGPHSSSSRMPVEYQGHTGLGRDK
jgi:hypothetical protein